MHVHDIKAVHETLHRIFFLNIFQKCVTTKPIHLTAPADIDKSTVGNMTSKNTANVKKCHVLIASIQSLSTVCQIQFCNTCKFSQHGEPVHSIGDGFHALF